MTITVSGTIEEILAFAETPKAGQSAKVAQLVAAEEQRLAAEEQKLQAIRAEVNGGIRDAKDFIEFADYLRQAEARK